MQPILYVFRLRDKGGLVITTDRSGSRLPIDADLDYTPSDWKFLQPIPSADLPKMLTSHREVESALTGWGYYAISARETLSHPLFQRHPA
jgi:hypothetical protein